MTIAIRLDKALERSLERCAEDEKTPKSELIRQCLREYLGRKRAAKTPWELGKELFGKFGSGRPDLSMNRKKIVREKIHASKDRRRLRPLGRSF